MGEVAELLQNLVELFADVVESLRGLWIRESRARPTLMLSATRCCCAPSWRSRSIFRRSASPVATMRARVARSSVFVDWSSAVRRPFSMASSSA